MYNQGSMDRIGRLMSLRDLVAAGQMAPDDETLPVNTLRNNSTGAEYQFASAPQGAQVPQLDYSQPIEIFGQGKGYAIKGQPLSAMINGRRVDYGVDGDASRKATQAAQDRAMKLAEQMQRLDAGALDLQRKQVDLGSAIGTLQAHAQGYEKQQGIDDGLGGGWPRDEQQPIAPPDLNGAMSSVAGMLGNGGEGGAIINGLVRTAANLSAQRARPSPAREKPLTESQGKAAGFGIRADDADSIIREIGGGGDVQPGLIKRAAEAVPFIGDALGTLTNWTQSEPQQKIEQAQRNFINAVLRKESGAVISPEEFDNARKQYFPQLADEPGTIAQKQANRQATIAALKTEGAQGYEQARAEFEARKAAISGGKKSQTIGGASQTDSLPDPRQEVGAIITDNTTGVRMQSDGKQWRIIGR